MMQLPGVVCGRQTPVTESAVLQRPSPVDTESLKGLNIASVKWLKHVLFLLYHGTSYSNVGILGDLKNTFSFNNKKIYV